MASAVISFVKTHATASINYACNFPKTHTVNNNICALFALDASAHTIYHIGQGIISNINGAVDYYKKTRADADKAAPLEAIPLVPADKAEGKVKVSLINSINNKEAREQYIKAGQGFATAAFFYLGTLNPVLGWVIPVIALYKDNWTSDANGFVLSEPLKYFGAGATQLSKAIMPISIGNIANAMEGIIPKTIDATTKVMGIAISILAIQMVHKQFTAYGLPNVNFLSTVTNIFA